VETRKHAIWSKGIGAKKNVQSRSLRLKGGWHSVVTDGVYSRENGLVGVRRQCLFRAERQKNFILAWRHVEKDGGCSKKRRKKKRKKTQKKRKKEKKKKEEIGGGLAGGERVPAEAFSVPAGCVAWEGGGGGGGREGGEKSAPAPLCALRE